MTGKENLVYLKKDMIDIELQLLIENSLQFGQQLLLEDIDEDIQDTYDDVGFFKLGFAEQKIQRRECLQAEDEGEECGYPP